MFDAVRNNKRIVQIFLALITLPFALWGVDSYVRNTGAGSDVAAVGDSKITQQEYSRAWREQLDQMRNALGPNFDPARFDTPEARKIMLDQLINRRLMLLEAGRLHLAVDNGQLRDVIARVPSLQENGQFSMARYEAMLRAQGYSQASFEAQLRQDLTLQQLSLPIGEAAIASSIGTDALLTALNETRSVAEIRFPPEAHIAQVKLSDDDLMKYYEASRKEFEEPEQVRVEFVTLNTDALKQQITVTPEQAKAWYEKNLTRYKQDEERRASHILITAESSAGDDVKAKAKAKAEDILKQVKANPGDFAKLAKQHSQDPGSAEKGGDLGFFGRGMMVKPFEDAAFALKEGEASDIVQSDFGFHIIRLTGIKPMKQKPFEEVRGEIEAELKQQEVQRKYAEAAETFANMVYEQSDSLTPVAERYKLSIEQGGWIVRGAPGKPGTPFANPRLLSALFGDDAIKNKRNTEAVEIAPNTIVAARVVEHKPVALRPFDAVKNEIRDRLTRAEASKLAFKAGEAKLTELAAGKDAGVVFATTKAVSRLAPADVPQVAVAAIFKTDSSKLPAFAGVAHPAGGYALYKIISVKPGAKLDERQTTALRGEYANALAQEEFNAYVATLKGRYKVEVNLAALETKDR